MMGVALKVLRGLSTNMRNAPFIDGSFHYETDTGRLWVDSLDGTTENRRMIGGNVIEITKTLDHTLWNGNVYDLAIEEVKTTSTGIIGVAQNANDAAYEGAKVSAMHLSGQSNGHLTITATSNAPKVDIPVTLFLFG